MVVSDSLVYYYDFASERCIRASNTSRARNLCRLDEGSDSEDLTFVNTDLATRHDLRKSSRYFITDGTNDTAQIYATDNANANVRGDITVGAWCRLEDTDLFAVVSKYNQYILGFNGLPVMMFIVYTTSWYPTNYNTNIWGDQTGIDYSDWHYWVGTYRKNPVAGQDGFTSLFCDGEPLVTDLVTFRGNGDNNGVLADDSAGLTRFMRRDSGGADFHTGGLAIAHCHTRALTAQEIKQNYLSNRERFR